jgi:hypothetical protein
MKNKSAFVYHSQIFFMKSIHLLLLVGFFLLSLSPFSFAQSTFSGQKVRGIIVDRASGNGIADAAIELLNRSPRIAVQTAEDGSFNLKNIPIGHQRFRVVAEGYYETVIPQLIVAGKEAVLTISLEEEIKTPLITVNAKKKKNTRDIRRFSNVKMEAVDEMNAVSNHKINVEEITKYAGNWVDPARMVSNLPGLFTIDDTQNYIVSRGNSPYGIRWEIEGVPVDNPQHFASLSNTGGVLPLLNINMLDNSDFVNGAMPANFGNSYSGVFDINLRKGNNQKFEFLGQFSLYGAEAMLEGPIKKGGASFMVSYRYGIFNLLKLLGVDFSSSGSPDYQDINFKINIPTKNAGEFTIFGIGGTSHANIFGSESDSSAIFVNKYIDSDVYNTSGVVGASNLKMLNRNTSMKTVIAHYFHTRSYRLDTNITQSPNPYYQGDETLHRTHITSTLNHKINAQTLFRAGIYGNTEQVMLHNRSLWTGLVEESFNGRTYTAGGFASFRHRFSTKFQAILGVHGRYWSLNKNSWSIEPRLSLNWYIARRHKISFGYGWHSKTQPLPVLFHLSQRPDGSYNASNQDLGSTRAHHAVLSYNAYISKFWALKVNLYTQLNTNIPIHERPSSFSLINYGVYHTFPNASNLVADGLSLSYGSEIAVEKFFNNGYYGLAGFTYARSFYQASDQIWRSTLFDVRYIIQATFGKEFKIGKEKRNVFYIDLKYVGRGGTPYIPIDLDASIQAGYEIRDNQNAYSQRLGAYNRIDVRLGLRFNNLKGTISHHIYLEALNVARFKNDLQVVFDPESNTVQKGLQFGLIPIIFYQIQF